MARILLLMALLGTVCWSPASSLKISAFNVQTMGKAKMDKPEVVTILTDIILKYDMILIQEIRDSSQVAIYELLDEVNSVSSQQYDIRMSTRAGRSSYKEQYAFFFKTDNMTVVDSFEYPDDGDKFEREPFVVLFDAPSTAVGQFAAMALHAKPDDAVAEIDLTTDVYDYTVSQWGINDVVIMGDLNADCDYVRDEDWTNIRLRSESRFEWVIPDDADTTVSGNTDCAYDRFVLAGTQLCNSYSQPAVFKFDDFYNLDYYAAKDVSDHYPVELNLD
ncbi:deoxyribonuclease-1-like [Diadema antillarum]|uniref:deoxyribonuclease-1-like n=1 Tax=Diadema antillarum TaxID=105358 RepID=UPI003A880DE0